MERNIDKKKKSDIIAEPYKAMPLVKTNFILMAVAGVMIVAGFLLMLGGSSTLEQYNPDIFSTRRIVVGPAITFVGFVFMAVALIVKPRGKHTENDN